MTRTLLSSSEDDELIDELIDEIDEIDEIDYDLLPLADFKQQQQQLDHTQIPARPKSAPPHLDNMRICLPPNKNSTNRYTNELFDATNNFIVKQRRSNTIRNLSDYRVIPPDQKFLNCVEWNQMEEVNFELDDVTRTRVFNNRFKRPIDEINPELSEYFRIHNNDNKENLNKPYKVTKKTPVLSRRKSLPLVETNNIQRKALSPFKNQSAKVATRPSPPPSGGPCEPRHQSLMPSKSCLSIEEAKVYLIESSTGLVNQATDFATELNGCTNESLPFPEHENEVVQIPTNSNDAHQMAIIRMFNFKLDKARKGVRTGFYSEKEFKDYQARLKKQHAKSAARDAGVEIVSQSSTLVDGEDSSKPLTKNKGVKWADKLEW
ncbi:hypothetical protein CANMA_002287 [Candida margitis]|uniref:uncharacterized protein n=1 Tax=Candida margitis TaxID=1775924 RepID=UPI002226E8CD|nr:uncharacterized protein CANMA_002287 [Candida margitis]KAI5968542.1 hypothetical protein CANMA_002287 [Candida margitis]